MEEPTEQTIYECVSMLIMPEGQGWMRCEGRLPVWLVSHVTWEFELRKDGADASDNNNTQNSPLLHLDPANLPPDCSKQLLSI